MHVNIAASPFGSVILDMPAVQAEQAALPPLCEVERPRGQSMHDVELMPPAKNPAGHAVHKDSPDALE